MRTSAVVSWSASLAVLLLGCRGSGVAQLSPAQVVLDTAQLRLDSTYVGQQARASVRVSNLGEATAALAVGGLMAPFAADVPSLSLGKGETREVTVTFSPTEPGARSAVLQVGEAQLALEAEGLEVPQCLPTDACALAAFDPVSAQCTSTPLPEGAACESSCLKGTCVAGTCRGALVGCDDADACTVDGCGPTGCTHAPRQCPAPSGPCRVATCDGALGCGAEDAPDGTLCGQDDCSSTQVDICLVGQCVKRPRPPGGRCSQTWEPVTRGNFDGRLVSDSARGSVLQLGTSTWEWKAGKWTQRYPANSLAWAFPLADDSGRGRVVAVGAGTTWEWDGLTWLPRFAPVSIRERSGHALAYDAERRRVVLFGGQALSGGALSDTWEWNGSTWVQRSVVGPPARFDHAMAYDAARKRVVLYGGSGPAGAPGSGLFEDTWEWDGNAWTQRPGGPGPRAGHAMAYDASRQRVFLYGGRGSFIDPMSQTRRNLEFSDTWTWGGVAWARPSPTTALGAAATEPEPRPLGQSSSTAQFSMAYDGSTQQLLLARGSQVWRWTGTSWSVAFADAHPDLTIDLPVVYDAARRELLVVAAHTWLWNGEGWRMAPGVGPRGTPSAVLAYDSARERVVWFERDETWEWDGLKWAQLAVAGPPSPRAYPAMAYDAARGKVVLFGGGGVGAGADTWEWDGVVWTQRLPLASPPGRSNANMAYDSVRQRVVLFGGWIIGNLPTDTWEWDGTTWTQVVTARVPYAGSDTSMTWDSDRKRVVLFGGDRKLWSYDGADWVPTEPNNTPRYHSANSLAYDEARHQLLWLAESLWRYLP